jgi:hypothetical protein
VSPRLSPHHHDARILEKYDVARSKWARYRRRKRRGPDGQPLANTQYLRYRSFWILLCEAGYHKFFEEHQKRDRYGNVTERQFFDVREKPIQYGGYSIGYAREKLSVRLSGKAYGELKRYYLAQARASTESLKWEFSSFPYAPWGGVLKQTFAILKAVNASRKAAGLPVVPTSCVVTKRKAVKPFVKSQALIEREMTKSKFENERALAA